MKLLLTGDNNFEIEIRLAQILNDYDSHTTNIDGSSFDIDLNAALLGQDMFNSKRLVLIRNISEDIKNFESLISLLPKVDKDISVVIVDQKLDKRTKLYKDLVNNVEIIEYNLWTENDISSAIKWTESELAKRSINLNKQIIEEIVLRSNMNQWNIVHTIEKIDLLAGEPFDIDDLLEPVANENVFKLIELVLSKDKTKIDDSIKKLRSSEDPFRLMALVISQFLIVTAIVNSTNRDNVAKDLAVSPYMVSKLVDTSRSQSNVKCKKILAILAEGDEKIKNANNDPWVIFSQVLIKTASV